MQAAVSEAEIEQSLVDRITGTLAQRIVAGLLPAGTRLRQEHIATEFGASHVPVREAFRRLEARGLLRSEPRRGVRVAPIDVASVLEVSEMRAALEILALRHAMDRLSSNDLDAAEAALKAGEQSRDLVSRDQANRQFHRILIVPCGMPRLLRAIDELHEAAARFLHATWRAFEGQFDTDTAEHRAVLSAVRAGDRDAACAMLRAHIVNAGHNLTAHIGSALAASNSRGS